MVALNKFPAAFRRNHEAKRFRFLKNDRPAIVIRPKRFGLNRPGAEWLSNRHRAPKGERFTCQRLSPAKRFGLAIGFRAKRFGLAA